MQSRSRAALLLLLVPLVACSPREERAESAREAAVAALARGDAAAALLAVAELRESLPDTADSVLVVAGLLAQAGDAAQALWLLEDAMARFPERQDLRLVAGRAALLVGDASRARATLQEVPAESEHHPQALVVQAQAELLLGDLEASLATLSRAESLYPELPDMRLPRIAALLREGRYDEGAAALERAKAAAGSDGTRAALRELELALHVFRAGKAEREEERMEAIAAVRRLVDEEPSDAAGWTALAELLFRDGRGEEARDLLRGALAANDGLRGLTPVLASAHARLGEDEEAERLLREIVSESPSPTLYVELAEFHVLRGNEADALAAIGEGVSAFPDVTPLRLYRAEYLIGLERPGEARAELEGLDDFAEDDPHRDYVWARLELTEGDLDSARSRLERALPALDSGPAHFWLGRVLELQGDLTGAERRYGLALSRDGRDPAAPLQLMRLAERTGNWEAVASAARLAAQRAPGRFDAWAGWVTALVHLGRADAAEELATKLSVGFAKEPESAVLMASALRAQGKFDEALEKLDAARDRFGPSERFATERALTLGLAGRLDEGVAAARQGLAEHPDSARLHAVLASILFSTGNADQTAAGDDAIERALELDPSDPEPLRTRARFRAATGDAPGARADCEVFLAARPSDPEVLFILAVVHEKSGQLDEAIRTYRRAAEVDARAFAPRNNLALLLDRQGDLDGAIEAAQQAYRLDEENPAVMDTLASLYLKKGLVDRSISLLEEAHAAAPEKTAVQLHLAMAYREAGRSDDARRVLTDLRPRTGPNSELRVQVDETIATLP